MKALAQAMLDAFREAGLLAIILNVGLGAAVVAMLVVPLLRSVLASRTTRFDDARRTAKRQAIAHAAIITAAIVVGKAVCVDRVINNPWGTWREAGDLLRPETLAVIAVAYFLTDVAAFVIAGSSPKPSAFITNLLGGLCEACVVMPTCIASYWSMSMSLSQTISWWPFEAVLIIGASVGFVLWVSGSFLTHLTRTAAKRRRSTLQLAGGRQDC